MGATKAKLTSISVRNMRQVANQWCRTSRILGCVAFLRFNSKAAADAHSFAVRARGRFFDRSFRLFMLGYGAEEGQRDRFGAKSVLLEASKMELETVQMVLVVPGFLCRRTTVGDLFSESYWQ